mmetsp:Transcript_36098/g.84611  ORF Transcript_36098/g.84611 Transcript_36098/m.84611 type:complete len:231 (-) Transcript_36098:34-726(-)
MAGTPAMLDWHCLPWSYVLLLFCLLQEVALAFQEEGWGVLGDYPERGTDAYFEALRTDYKDRETGDTIYFNIDIRIDPCRDHALTGGRNDMCCFDTSVAACQDYNSTEAGPDLKVAFFQNAHIPSCRNTAFHDDINCGTYLEIHKPADVRVWADAAIDGEPFINGYRTVNIATYRLCLGEYEIWWVVRTRSGPYVQKKRSFDITGPSCTANKPPGAVPAPTENLPPPDVP